VRTTTESTVLLHPANKKVKEEKHRVGIEVFLRGGTAWRMANQGGEFLPHELLNNFRGKPCPASATALPSLHFHRFVGGD
jgi:hypothetical protein